MGGQRVDVAVLVDDLHADQDRAQRFSDFFLQKPALLGQCRLDLFGRNKLHVLQNLPDLLPLVAELQRPNEFGLGDAHLAKNLPEVFFPVPRLPVQCGLKLALGDNFLVQ